MKEIKSIVVPLPPRDEQARIAAEVERHLSVADDVEAALSANLQRAARLRQSLLSRAFAGKLATQETLVLKQSKAKPIKGPHRHFYRAVLSAEIVDQLHSEPTFGHVKHQKILHLCEYIAQLEEIQGQYHRDAAGPLDNKMIHANDAELKKQKWYEIRHHTNGRFGYHPLSKAGQHRQYFSRYWNERSVTIQRIIDILRKATTEQCEIISTTYAAWNDLLIWSREVTDEAILHEILNRWHDEKRRIPEKSWRNAIIWMRERQFVPIGFGAPTTQPGEDS